MKKSIVLSAVFAATAITAVRVTLMTAQTQSVDVYITPTQPYSPPPRGGAFGDRDRDGVPNRWDARPNNPWR